MAEYCPATRQTLDKSYTKQKDNTNLYFRDTGADSKVPGPEYTFP